MKRSDAVTAACFFGGMAAFGALILYFNRARWQHDLQRQEQQHRVLQADLRAAAARQRLDAVRRASGEERRRGAREAADLYTFAMEVNPGIADLAAGRAEALALAGDPAAARRDLARAKELEPARDWSDLEKLCATTP